MSGVLLVHGAWHGPWCWDDFGDHLRAGGHRGQGRAVAWPRRVAPGRIWHRMHHYLDDVERAAAEFAEPPVVVGHSMGGLLTQRYLEREKLRAGRGARGRHSADRSDPGGRSARRPRSARVREGEPPPAPVAVRRYVGTGPRAVLHSRNDAGRRGRLRGAPAGRVLPGLRRHGGPLVAATAARRGADLVLGAERDGIISVDEVHRTAPAPTGQRPRSSPVWATT